MEQVVKWTYLPWEDQGVAGIFCCICLGIGAVFALVSTVIRTSKLGYDIHVAPFWTVQAYVYAIVVNTALAALFFWYAALAIGILFSLVCLIAVRGVQGKAYLDEKNGKWGLSPALREVRGEMFSDLPEAEQVARKAEIDASFHKLRPVPFMLITILAPAAVILICRICGLPYVLMPHAI